MALPPRNLGNVVGASLDMSKEVLMSKFLKRLFAVTLVAGLAGCATYDYGYPGYSYAPYYNPYGYDGGPYYYGYGYPYYGPAYYYGYGAPSVGFSFGYHDHDRHYHHDRYAYADHGGYHGSYASNTVRPRSRTDGVVHSVGSGPHTVAHARAPATRPAQREAAGHRRAVPPTMHAEQ